VIFDDLVAEQERLESILDALDDAAWASPSGAVGWSIADVVLHLAQTEEAVVASARGESLGLLPDDGPLDDSLDSMMDRNVREQRAEQAVVFERWRKARRAAVAALRDADPAQRLPWAAAPLKPTTLATTRLAEHWAHGLDITGPLDIPFPDTDRLRHIAWLAHGSLPYAFTLVGETPHDVYCELEAPDGTTWQYGSPETESTITGSAGIFCRVGARRLAPEDSGLVATGPYGPVALRALRNYAG
jgi:uncharacterized protein (TIGR03084 family)